MTEIKDVKTIESSISRSCEYCHGAVEYTCDECGEPVRSGNFGGFVGTLCLCELCAHNFGAQKSDPQFCQCHERCEACRESLGFTCSGCNKYVTSATKIAGCDKFDGDRFWCQDCFKTIIPALAEIPGAISLTTVSQSCRCHLERYDFYRCHTCGLVTNLRCTFCGSGIGYNGAFRTGSRYRAAKFACQSCVRRGLPDNLFIPVGTDVTISDIMGMLQVDVCHHYELNYIQCTRQETAPPPAAPTPPMPKY